MYLNITNNYIYMEAKIVQILTTGKPKSKFYILEGTNRHRIAEVNSTGVKLDNGEERTIDEVKDKLLRYEAHIGQKRFHVCYPGYNRISDGMVVDGYTIEMHRNAYEGDIIRITDINVIDEHGLHDVKMRTGEIIRILNNNRFNPEYEIQMENVQSTRKLFKLKRTSFMLLERDDTRQYFHPRCTECGN